MILLKNSLMNSNPSSQDFMKNSESNNNSVEEENKYPERGNAYETEGSNKITKSDANLELLKDFEYDTEIRGTELDGKPLMIYICRFGN